jgi:hypothetical protein
METARVKRPRGRPRRDAPPRPKLHVEVDPLIKTHLETAAKAAERSLVREFNVRLSDSFARDEVYGGLKMAALFRELAQVAVGIARQKNRGAFFEDFGTFVLTRGVWLNIIQRHMPRPDEGLLAAICREWDPTKPPTSEHAAALEWLQVQIFERGGVTLQHVLAAGVPTLVENRKPPSEQAAETPLPSAADDEVARREIGSLTMMAAGLNLPEDDIGSVSLDSAALSIGSLAKVMEGLIPSQGSVRSAAAEVSRLAQLLADAVGEPASADITPSPEGQTPTLPC